MGTEPKYTGILELEASKTGFPSLGTIHILGQIHFVVGAVVWMSSSISELYLLDANGTDLPSPKSDNKKCS